jgi:hypothetical protein
MQLSLSSLLSASYKSGQIGNGGRGGGQNTRTCDVVGLSRKCALVVSDVITVCWWALRISAGGRTRASNNRSATWAETKRYSSYFTVHNALAAAKQGYAPGKVSTYDLWLVFWENWGLFLSERAGLLRNSVCRKPNDCLTGIPGSFPIAQFFLFHD